MKKRVLKLLTSSVCLLILSTSSVMAEDPVYFADANLKAAVENEVGITDPTPTDMLALTFLYTGDSVIRDFTGIEYASNLMKLGLSYVIDGRGDNHCRDISPLSGLTNLTYLNLSFSNICNISPLSGLTSLTVLVLEGNPISDISPLSGLTNLTDLYLDNNQIIDISALSEFANLWILTLRSNPLNVEAYCTYLPLIEDNNPGIDLMYDPNPYPPEDCLDDDGVSDGLFSIDGTKWGACVIYLGTYAPFMNIECPSEDFTGFYQGTVYGCSSEDYCMTLEGSSYSDLQGSSIFTLNRVHSNLFGILYPSGLGVVTHFVNSFGPMIPSIRLMFGVMYKVDDNFLPLIPPPLLELDVE